MAKSPARAGVTSHDRAADNRRTITTRGGAVIRHSRRSAQSAPAMSSAAMYPKVIAGPMVDPAPA